MEEYTLVGKGLRTIFWGTVVSILGAVVSWIPLIGTAVSVVGGAAVLYGIYIATPAHDNFNAALWLKLAALVLTVLKGMFKKGLPGGILSILATVVGLLITYYICSATGALLEAKGDRPQADRAALIVKLYLACAAVSILCTLVSWVPLVNILAAVAAGLTGAVQVCADIMLIYFYYTASASLLR